MRSRQDLDQGMRESPREECGVIGVYAPGQEVARIAYFGLYMLQHRGQESAGIAVSNGERIAMHKEMGLVSQVFDEEILGTLSGHIAIGHTRYSTTGSCMVRNAQPIACTSAMGDVAVAHNGNLVNSKPLRRELEEEGRLFRTTNDSEIIAQLLAFRSHSRIEDAVPEVMERLQGAYSLAILTRNQLVGLRDPYGIRPLCIGRINGTGHHMIASETCALHVNGASFVRDVEPGEMVVIDSEGMREYQAVPLKRHATCLFEFIYFARPDSHIYGQSLHMVRRRMGHELAREHPAPNGQVVIPIPDSAIPAALGFAEAARIPYSEGIVKNRYIQRTFIQPSQAMRDRGVLMKYSPLREVIAGKRVVMVDDSIVRGTTTGKLVRMLREAGAIEVHVRISAPPVTHPCFYGIDMATRSELIAAQKSIEEIRQHIEADSLGYLSLNSVVTAVGLSKNKFCRACFDGQYPIRVPRGVKVAKDGLEHLEAMREAQLSACGGCGSR